MKVVGIFASILLLACADTSMPVELKEVKACSQKCKKSYGIGNKYQQIQKQKRCKQRCQHKEGSRDAT